MEVLVASDQRHRGVVRAVVPGAWPCQLAAPDLGRLHAVPASAAIDDLDPLAAWP
jgi:hypothetical protein